MKKLTLTLCAVTAVVSASFAGTSTYSSKDSKQVAQTPCPTWYADNEFNVGISGLYAATTNEYRQDRYLGVDHGFGGAIDAKYFFHRYFGVGVQGFGFGLSDQNRNGGIRVGRFNNNDIAGGALGTFTLRYPIPCSRFAPYAWVGAGGIWGGRDRFRNLQNNDDNNGTFMGQYGAGLEVRFTSHFGWTNDVSWNQVNGANNDFVQVRSGLNFAF